MDLSDRTLNALDWILPPAMLEGSKREASRARLAVFLALATMVWGPIFAVVYFSLGAPVGAAILFVATLLCGLTPLSLKYTGSLEVGGHQVAASLWVAVIGLCVITGGVSAPAMPWIAAAPLLALAIGGWRCAASWAAIAALGVVGMGSLTLSGRAPVSVLTPWMLDVVHLLGAGGLILFLTSLLGLYQREHERLDDALVGQVAALESANHAKSLFLANMSHELRTPMNAILGYSEMVSEELEGDPLQSDVNRVLSSGHHLLRLIDDLLDISRIEVGELVVDCAPHSLGGAAVEVMERFQPVATLSNTTLLLEDSGEGALAHCDLGRVLQILSNLVDNSLKFAAGSTVGLRVFTAGEWVCVVVEDGGPGIPSDSLETVFDEFQQAHPAIRAAHGGTGLGLAISRRLARAMGGDLSASGAAGGGCRMRLRLRRLP